MAKSTVALGVFLSLTMIVRLAFSETSSEEESRYLLEMARASELDKAKVALIAQQRARFLEESQFHSQGSSCLAYHKFTGDCIVPVPRFNTQVAVNLPDSIETFSDSQWTAEKQKLRKRVLDDLFEGAFLSEAGAWLHAGSDTAGYKPQVAWADSVAAKDRPLIPLFLRLNAGVRVQVASSSDSVWLSDLFKSAPRHILPSNVLASELTDSILEKAARLRPGNWSEFMRLPFGFLSVSRPDALPSPRLLAALGLELASYKPQSGRDLERMAKEEMRVHPEVCKAPDTLMLLMQLRPAGQTATESGQPKWKAITSQQLPASMASMMWRNYHPGKKDTLGPIPSPFGIVRFSFDSLRVGSRLGSGLCLDRTKGQLVQEQFLAFARAKLAGLAGKDSHDGFGVRPLYITYLASNGDANPEATYRELKEKWVSKTVRMQSDL